MTLRPILRQHPERSLLQGCKLIAECQYGKKIFPQVQSNLRRLGAVWLYSRIAFSYCLQNFDSKVHTIQFPTFSFLSVHSTEEPKGTSDFVKRTFNKSCNVMLSLLTRMRAACAVIGRGTQLNKGWVSSHELLLQLIPINDNTIAVHYSWESFPNV